MYEIDRKKSVYQSETYGQGMSIRKDGNAPVERH